MRCASTASKSQSQWSFEGEPGSPIPPHVHPDARAMRRDRRPAWWGGAERGGMSWRKSLSEYQLTARATLPGVGRSESFRADMVILLLRASVPRWTGRGCARVSSSAIPFLALGFRPSSCLGGALFGGLCPVVASQTSFMHPRWDVGAFDFEDRMRATLPADSRAMRFL